MLENRTIWSALSYLDPWEAVEALRHDDIESTVLFFGPPHHAEEKVVHHAPDLCSQQNAPDVFVGVFRQNLRFDILAVDEEVSVGQVVFNYWTDRDQVLVLGRVNPDLLTEAKCSVYSSQRKRSLVLLQGNLFGDHHLLHNQLLAQKTPNHWFLGIFKKVFGEVVGVQ